MMPHPWIADRTLAFDSSGIRKVFDLAGKIKNPINLSIGQPDFDVPIAVQDAMVKRHGSQCGFCTPGFVMSLAALHLDGAPANQAETYIAGNLCRCTGYDKIIKAVQVAAAEMRGA